MKTGVRVLARLPGGRFGPVDVADLTDESFRRFVALIFAQLGVAASLPDALNAARDEPYHAKDE